MEKFFRGIPGSSRIAIGKAVVFIKPSLYIPKYTIEQSAESIENELDKLEKALERTKNQLEELKKEIEKTQSAIETGYIDSSILMLEDPYLKKRVTEKLRESYFNIEWIFNEVIEEIAEKLETSEDSYFKERAPDVKSIGIRVIKNLLGEKEFELPRYIKEPIVIAHTLSPPEIVSFYKKGIKGIVTEVGGKTSHVAIMARDLKIPAILGINHITKHVKTGDRIIVDGTVGTVVVNPNEDTLKLYKYKEKEYEKYDKYFSKFQKKPCRLKEGEEIKLLANIDVEEEVNIIDTDSCAGIGLFRTEYILMHKDYYPDEDEQFEIYSRIAKKISPLEINIRCFDFGGDKIPPYMEKYEEKNPFLGWRGLRYALHHIDMLKTQIRAILRASFYGNIKIMFPMVNDMDDVSSIMKVIDECKIELREKREKYVDIPVGVMIETPASVLMLDKIIEDVDFISVGTNDLIQYTLAIDRGNGLVASEYDPTHPAIIRSLNEISMICAEEDVDVSICGEMAGDPLFILLLIGLGFRKFSMSLMNIPIIKSIIVNSSLQDANKIASTVLMMNTKKEINNYIKEEMLSRFDFLEEYLYKIE